MSAKAHILVLLHPFPMDASFWGPMWRELDAEVTLLTPEFPGFGAAPLHDAPDIATFADTVADAIREEQAGAATVVGLSLGGYVALALVARHPDTVRALVLANTRATADSPDARANRDRAIDTVRIDGARAYLDALLSQLLGPAAPPDAWERAAAIAENQTPEAIVGALAALRDRPDRSDELASIAVPALVVVGSEDTVTPPAEAAALAGAITGARLVEIPGAGHLSALEDPTAFAAHLATVLPAADAAG